MCFDDRRIQLPTNNLFRFCAKGEVAEVPNDVRGIIVFRTGAEMGVERLSAKLAG